MKTLLILFHLPLIWSYRGFQSKTELKIGELCKELELYVHYTKSPTPFYTCNAFVSPEDTFCGDLITGYLKSTRCAKLVSDYSHGINLNDDYTSVSFLTMGSKEQFDEKLKKLLESSFFSNRGKYSFIVCAQVRDSKWVLEVSKRLWSHRILNFVLVFLNGTLKVATYNPFEGQLRIKDVREMLPGFEQFPDKLKNMQGYPFKVLTVSVDMPATSQYTNYEYNFVKSLPKYFNLTLLETKIDLNSSFNSYIYKRLASEDIELYPHTLTVDGLDVPKEFSFKVAVLKPHIMDHWAIIVPKAQRVEKWKRFTQSLIVEVLPLSLAVALMAALLNKTLSRKSKPLNLFGFVAVQFRTSLPNFLREKSFIKCSWMLWCIIYGTLVDMINLNIALVTHYGKDINTMEQLQQSSLNIYSLWLEMPEIQNVTMLGSVEWLDKFLEGKGDSAFIAPNSQLELLAKWLRIQNKRFDYKILDKSVRSGYGAFMSKSKSPYLRSLEKLALLVRQMESTSKLYNRRQVELDHDQRSRTLKLEEFLGTMVVWMVGLGISTIVFLVECWWQK